MVQAESQSLRRTAVALHVRSGRDGADDDDNKRIHCLTSVDRTVEHARLLAIDIKSHESFEGPTKVSMSQKPNARSRQ